MADQRDPWGRGEESRPYIGLEADPYPSREEPPRRPPLPAGQWRAPPGLQRLPPRPAVPPVVKLKKALRQNANAVCGGLTLVFVIGPLIVWIITAARWMIPRFDSAIIGLAPLPLGLINMSIQTLSLFLPAIIITRLLHMPAHQAFPMGRASARLVVPGVFCCLGMAVVGGYISALLKVFFSATVGATPISPDFSPPTHGLAETLLFVVGISVIPAIFEEVLFRGVILQSLRRFGDGFALGMSSLLFAMLHRNFVQGPNALLVGMVLGYFTLRAGSILPAIIMHFCNNLVVAVVSVISLYLPTRYAEMLNLSILPAYLVLGVVGVVLMVVLNGGFIRLHEEPGELGGRQKTALFMLAPLALLFTLVTLVQTIVYFE